MRYTKWLGALCAIGVLCFQAGLARAAPESGVWWNPDQSGRGFAIEVQGATVFMGTFLYEANGRSTWYASAGPLQADGAYQGTMQAYGNGQTLTGAYKANAVTNANAGNIALQFTDATHGTLTWPGGTIPIERYVFDSRTPSFKPDTGLWWNAAETGRGFLIEVQGTILFMGAYMYDDAGNPVWYSTSGPMTSTTLFQGHWDQYSGGQTMTGAYRPPASPPANAGNLTLQFTSTTTATLTLPDARQIQLTRFYFAPSGPTTAPNGGFPVNEIFAAELVGKGAPVDVARFFAAAKLESSSPNPNTYVYRQTFPNGATRDMTLTITPQQYTPTPDELAKFAPGTSPIYSFTYGSSVQPDGTMQIDLHYFVPNDGLPAELRTRLQSSALTADGIQSVAQALDGPVAGAGITWQETGKKGTDWSIGTALELAKKYPIVEATGSIYALASALSDISEAVELSKQINKWLAELDALEKCAANPTNPLSKSDPNYSKDAVAKIQQARRELKEVSAVRFLNIMTETGAGLTPASAALAVALKSGFQWNDQTLKDYSENTIMREARAAVVPCSALKVDGIYWGAYHLTGVICNLENTFALQAQSIPAASGVFTFTPAGTSGGTWIFSGVITVSGWPVTANGTYQIAGAESGTPQILMDPGNGTWVAQTPVGAAPMGPGGNHLEVPATITMAQTTEPCPAL